MKKPIKSYRKGRESFEVQAGIIYDSIWNIFVSFSQKFYLFIYYRDLDFRKLILS